MVSTESLNKFLAQITEIDNNHIYHPYSSITDPDPVYFVKSAKDVYIYLQDGTRLIDGMSSWWAAIHGYNNDFINKAIKQQLDLFSHVMFGGFSHEPAVKLTEQLLEITHPDLEKIFYCDSGSVAVEVALKMAIQYFYSQGYAGKNHILTVKSGYHGDTIGAMSLCDPNNGMHKIFSGLYEKILFAEAPPDICDEATKQSYINSLLAIIEKNHQKIAAFIIEPIFQNAGGLRFYPAEYLSLIKKICKEFKILLIFDEIATGFGRTGTMFAYEHADICPDIICVGKALTGGYMSMAATITSKNVADGIYGGLKMPFMHGPTFMANPLSCIAASASISLLLAGNFKEKIPQIEGWFRQDMEKFKKLPSVKDVRILGAIAVVEMQHKIPLRAWQKQLVNKGVWLRPYRNMIYIIPPYIINRTELSKITEAIFSIIKA